MDFGIMLDMLIMACGIYMIYWAIRMKQTKKIPEMLVGKGFNVDRAKDPAGFIRATFPFTLIAGIITLLAGMTGVLEVFSAHPLFHIVLSFLFVGVIILYGIFLLRAQKKYLTRG